MTELTLRQHADPGERFAPGCFGGQIGKASPFNVGEGESKRQVGSAVLVSAEVDEDGRAATLTLEVSYDKLPPGVADVLGDQMPAMSFGFSPGG